MTAAHDSAPAVVVDGVSKAFRLPHEKVSTLKERALHPFRRSRYDRLDALKDVSFVVPQGEFFGIVGRNGSGKSTLLKCLAGIYRVDQGGVYINGRVSTFIELGVGFNPDLAARDNVLINGVMLGLSPREALERYDRVIDFAGLREFEELKLKNYSSGMHVRLAFSVMIQVDADVLMIDEVLAVGDAAFQQKCFDVFNRLRDEGRTILFVTHDMGSVRRFCHRAMLLDRGGVRMIGDPGDVGDAYVELNFGDGSGAAPAAERVGDGSAEIVEAWWEDTAGERQGVLHQGRPAVWKMRIRFNSAVDDAVFSVVFENDRQQPLMATNTEWAGEPTGPFEAGDEAVFSVQFDVVFAPGRVYASPWVHHQRGALMDRRPQMISAVVTGPHQSGALIDLPHDVRLETPGRVLAGGPTR